MDNIRGVIRNRNHATQVNDFSGLTWGKITPTDIDCFLDFGNKLFVIVEGKHDAAPLYGGQRLALERLCDACHKPPKMYAMLLAVSHNVAHDSDIDFSKTIVTEYRWGGIWQKPSTNNLTLREAIDTIKNKVIPNPAIEKHKEWISDYESAELCYGDSEQ